MASIQIIQGPDKGLSLELTGEENFIGRQSREVPLSDGTASRQHARLVRKDKQWLLEDLGSANGTYLNGVKLAKPAVLKRGDQIRCGSTLLVFGGGEDGIATVDVDETGQLVDAAIVATLPSNEDSVILPTPEAGAEAIDNLRILYEFISEVGSVFNVDVLLQRTLEKIFDIVNADRGYIMLIDTDGQLDLKASRLSDDSEAEQIPISRTIINEVITKKIGVLCSNAMSDKRFTAGKSVHDFGIRSAVCVPINGRQRILGVIHVDCGVSEHTYTTEQLRLLTAVGYQIGLAVENVRLHEAAVQSERLAAVGETTAFLSHHIKNILQALGGGAEMVETGLSSGELDKAQQAWPIVQRNLDQINALILNMLAFSKQREPLLESTEINDVLNDCVQLIMPQADERNIVVISSLDEMPPIPADAAGLQQAITNLLTNAIDAVKNETGIVTIASKYDSINRNAVIRVVDNGSGISPDAIKDIFTPFYSGKGQKGTGLGLAVAKKVFDEHNGLIEVKSTPGEGTTFTLTLSAMRAAPSEDAESAGDSKVDTPVK